MNILMIGESYKFGGASEIMEILAHSLEKNGHTVTLVYGYNYEGYEITSGHYVLFNNILLRRIHNRLRYWVERFNFRSLYVYCYIKLLMKKKRIDLIHIHAMQGGFMSLPDIKRICSQEDVVWTVHDTWPITGGCMYYWDCQAWQNAACINCVEDDLKMKYRNTAVNWRRKKKAFQNKEIYYVAPSKWMLRNMLHSFLKKERLTVIENGIDLKVFRPLFNSETLKFRYGVDVHKKILMFSAGSVKNKYKGWNYLRDALHWIKNREEYQLLIIGKETEDIECLDIAMIKLGFIQEKSVLNELYNIADVFILPSVQDNFPTVTLEAQAAGTPVLAFAIGGITEQITPETGWLVEEISAKGLRGELERIFEDKNWINTIKAKGKMARERSELLYGERRMTERYEEIYAEKKIHTKSNKFRIRKQKNIL